MAVVSGDPTVTEEREARSGRVEVDAVVTLSETAASSLAPAPVVFEAGVASAESIEIAVVTTADPALSAPAPVVPVTGVAPLVLYFHALCIVCEP